MAFITTNFQTSKKTAQETRRKARYIQEGDNDPVYVGYDVGTRSRVITVVRKGIGTQSECDAQMESGDTTGASPDGSGTITTSNKSRSRIPGLYWVDVTTDTIGAWSWTEY